MLRACKDRGRVLDGPLCNVIAGLLALTFLGWRQYLWAAGKSIRRRILVHIA